MQRAKSECENKMLFSIFSMIMPTFVILYHRAFYPRKALANFKGSPFSSLLSLCHHHAPPPTSPRRYHLGPSVSLQAVLLLRRLGHGGGGGEASHMAAAAILASIAATAHCISALLLSREKKYRACAKNGWRCGRAVRASAERRALSQGFLPSLCRRLRRRIRTRGCERLLFSRKVSHKF